MVKVRAASHPPVRIARAWVEPYALPLRRVWVMPDGLPVRERTGWLLCVEDTDGVRGVGEAVLVPGVSSERAASVARALDAIGRRLEGRSLAPTLAGWSRTVRAVGPVGGGSAAHFALETALADLCSKAWDRPLWRWLHRGPGRTLWAAAVVAPGAPEVSRAVAQAVEDGARAVKVKVHGDASRDLPMLQAACDALGSRNALLRIDANGRWAFEDAARIFDGLAPWASSIDFVEQPLAPGRESLWPKLRDVTPLAIAADESLARAAAARRILACGLAQVLVVKPAVLGGLRAAMRLAWEACGHGGVRVVLSDALCTAVGRAATAHLAVALPWTEPVAGLGTAAAFAQAIASDGPRVEGGEVRLPPGAGLGVQGGPRREAPLRARAPATQPTSPALRGRRRRPRPAPSGRALRRPVPHPAWHRTLWHAGEAAAVDAHGAPHSWAQLARRAEAYRTWLEEEGVRAGDRVAWSARGGLDVTARWMALGALGATPVLAHPRWPEARARAAAERAGARWLERWEATAEREALRPAPVAVDEDDVAVVLFTSGSSGEPKPVELTWRHLTWSTLGSAARLGSLPGDRWLCPLPVAHMGGFAVIVRAAWLGAVPVWLHRFDASFVADQLAAGGVALASLVPAMLDPVLDALGSRRVHPAVRAILVGGAALDEGVARRAARAGMPLAPTWGMTEAASQVATARPSRRGPWALRPLVTWQVRAGDDGRLWVRGPSATAPGAHGWMPTADRGSVDPSAGVRVVGRVDDVVVSGGENVDLSAVEAVLRGIEGVRDACAVALCDPRWGAVVAAAVELRDVSLSEVVAAARRRLAPWERPRPLLAVDTLPRTGPGKADRRAVRALLEAARSSRSHAGATAEDATLASRKVRP